MKKLLLPIVFMMMLACGVFAQTATPSPTPTDSEFDLMQRAQMVAEIKMLRAKNTGLETQVTESGSHLSEIRHCSGSTYCRLKRSLKVPY